MHSGSSGVDGALLERMCENVRRTSQMSQSVPEGLDRERTGGAGEHEEQRLKTNNRRKRRGWRGSRMQGREERSRVCSRELPWPRVCISKLKGIDRLDGAIAMALEPEWAQLTILYNYKYKAHIGQQGLHSNWKLEVVHVICFVSSLSIRNSIFRPALDASIANTSRTDEDIVFHSCRDSVLPVYIDAIYT